MTGKKARIVQNKIIKELKAEKKNICQLRLAHPEMFRKCGDSPCCQATNTDGTLCTRPAMTDKSYIKTIRCCYLCWQHALIYGVYITYKLAKLAGTAHLDWDSYCAYYPNECDDMLKISKTYK